MERFSAYAVIPVSGAHAPGATVRVLDLGTDDLVVIYDDNLSPPTPKGNPFTSDALTGFFYFYAADGRYDVRLSGGGIPSPYTWGDRLLYDPWP